MKSEFGEKSIAAGGCEVNLDDFAVSSSGGCSLPDIEPRSTTGDFPDDYLYDYGYGLKVRRSDIALIPAVDILSEGAIHMGAVYDTETQSLFRLYRVGDDVVRLAAQTGVEG